MKEEMLAYLNDRIDWHKREQARLKAACCADEAAHVQIAINVYGIFMSVYQAVRFDLDETLRRFSGIVSTWDESHRAACEHGDEAKKFVEEIKISRAMEIIRRAKELEERV
ncbi:MAG: hypothetical protein IJA83_05825 [Clostridia bacterium]|nr:hypothetical protein [Clostridia bacterium]